MKIQAILSLFFVGALVGLNLCSQGCRSPADLKAQAQFPAAELAWPGVRSDYVRGIDNGVSVGSLTASAADGLRAQGDALGAALTERDRVALRLVPWSAVMRPLAEAGIADKLEDGEVGPTVASELLERVQNFTETIESLQAP